MVRTGELNHSEEIVADGSKQLDISLCNMEK